jgi:hypothetical protein
VILRTTSFLSRVAAAALVGLLVLLGLAAWRLSLGPLQVDFLRHYAARTVDTPNGKVTLAAQHVLLSWEAGGGLRVVLDDVRAVDTHGITVARVPEATIDLSLASLLAGSFTPTSIVLDKASLDVVIGQDGLVSMLLPSQDADPSARILPLLVEQLLQEPNDAVAFGRLNEVRISAARLRLDDRASGFVWEAPAAGAVLLRDAQGVLVRARTELRAGGQTATIDFNGVYSRNRERIFARISVADLRPSLFATASPELAALGQLDLPMSGRLEVLASGTGEINRISLDLEGKTGKVTIPGVFAEPKPVSSVVLKAFAEPAKGELTLERFDVAFDGPTASIRGRITTRERKFSIDGTAELRDVPTARVAEFWPLGFARGGRAWAIENITDGALDRAGLAFTATGSFDTPDKIQVGSLDGTLNYHGLTIRYLTGVGPVRGVDGTGTFDGKVLRFETTSGMAGPVAMKAGQIDILGLDGSDNHRADVRLTLEARAADAMQFLEQPRFAIPANMMFNPRRLGGDVQVKLGMRFPLVGLSSISQVDYAAQATLRRFSLANAVRNLNLSDGEATLDVNPRELAVKGKARLDGTPLDIVWRENFGAKPAFRRRYEVRGTAPFGLLARAGVVVPDRYASGSVGIDATYVTSAAGHSEVTARLNLAPTRLALPELHWEKVAGTEGHASLAMRFAGANPTSVDFDTVTAGLSAKGRVDLRADGQWQQVALSRLLLGQTDLAATAKRTPSGLAVDVRGRSLELARISDQPGGGGNGANGNGSDGRPAWAKTLAVTVDLGQLVLKRGHLPGIRGTASVQGDRIASGDIRVGNATRVVIEPAGRNRTVRMTSDDIGTFLRTAGWIDGIQGGRFDFNGTTDDSSEVMRIHTRVQLRDFRFARVPPGRPIGDLNGIIDGLDRLGDPMAPFSLLDMHLERTGDILAIRQMRTNNGSIGVALNGTLNVGTDMLRIDGTAVPAYVINNLLSNVPLLGTILTGGPDGGVFAINFGVDGPIDKPRVSINPISALAPGILRNLFGAGSSAEEPAPPRSRESEPRGSGRPP